MYFNEYMFCDASSIDLICLQTENLDVWVLSDNTHLDHNWFRVIQDPNDAHRIAAAQSHFTFAIVSQSIVWLKVSVNVDI